MSTEEQYRKDYDVKLASKLAELSELAVKVNKLGSLQRILKNEPELYEQIKTSAAKNLKEIIFLEKPKFNFEQMNTPYGL